MRALLVLSCLLFLFPGLVQADQAHSRKLAEELLQLNNVQSQVEQLFSQMKRMVEGQLSVTGMPAESQAKADELLALALQMLDEEMSWTSMKDEYIDLYASTFSAEELQAIVDFSKSPVGRQINAKMPELTQKSMAIGQRHAQGVLPKITQAVQDYLDAEQAATPGSNPQ